MNRHLCLLGCLIAVGLGLPPQAAAAGDAELTDLDREIEEIRRDYEARIRALEERVEAVEKPADEAGRTAASDGEDTSADRKEPTAGARSENGEPEVDAGSGGETVRERATAAWSTVSKTFNPSISAIMQGRVAYLQGWEGSRNFPGFPIGAPTDRGAEGISLGESELVFSSNVDDKFYGFLDVSFDEDEIGVEEAYFSTLSLPLGFGFKGGQFLSSIGYHNDRHPHSWDFVDTPLVYEAMLDGAFSDPGMQVSWVAPTDLYFELGSEVFRGDTYPAAGAAYHGFGTVTAFAKLSGDVGEGSSWKGGLSYLRAEADGRLNVLDNGTVTSFDGSTDLIMFDFIWKWAPLGNYHERNFTFQTEYIHRHDDGDVTSSIGGGGYSSEQDGFYAQVVYQFIPRWRIGLRYGQLWGEYGLAGLPPEFSPGEQSAPLRVSTMLDFSSSEFGRFRLQYSYEAGGLGNDSLVYLQYIISIGSHGAHAF